MSDIETLKRAGIKDPSFDFMTISQLVKMGIIAKPLDGNHGEIHPKSEDFVESGVPFIMASDVINGVIDYSNCKFISRKQADSLRKGFAKNGDVLLTHKATIGRTAIVNYDDQPYVMLIPLQILEKDILVTELLNSLASIKVAHNGFKGNQQQYDTGINLAFAGGTCLSKAYGVLNRMSEDIDMKVLLDNNPNLKIGAPGRMKALDLVLADLVVQLGFIDSVEDLDKYKKVRNSHKYVAIELPYESRFPAFAALRSSKVKLGAKR